MSPHERSSESTLSIGDEFSFLYEKQIWDQNS